MSIFEDFIAIFLMHVIAYRIHSTHLSNKFNSAHLKFCAFLR